MGPVSAVHGSCASALKTLPDQPRSQGLRVQQAGSKLALTSRVGPEGKRPSWCLHFLVRQMKKHLEPTLLGGSEDSVTRR